MGESNTHQNLVLLIKKHFHEIVPTNTSCFISCDTIGESNIPPQTLNGYRPDVYYSHNDLLMIGEAKTSKDLERKHSISQYKSFMNTCAQFTGKKYFFLFVPWNEFISAKNLLKRLQKQYNYDVVIKVGCDFDIVEMI